MIADNNTPALSTPRKGLKYAKPQFEMDDHHLRKKRHWFVAKELGTKGRPHYLLYLHVEYSEQTGSSDIPQALKIARDAQLFHFSEVLLGITSAESDLGAIGKMQRRRGAV